MGNTKRVAFTGEGLRQMRLGRGMLIKDFWGNIGYSVSRGHAYETGRSKIPEHARRLIHLHYVLGLPTNPDTPEGRELAERLKQQHPIQLGNAVRMVEQGLDIIKGKLE
jgi:hypothetical protein